MTKADIVSRVAGATGVTKLETEILIDGFFKTIADALIHGEHLEIRGFGTFKIKKRLARTARNPRTGDPIELGEHYVPTFKASRELRAMIDERQKKGPDEGQKKGTDERQKKGTDEPQKKAPKSKKNTSE